MSSTARILAPLRRTVVQTLALDGIAIAEHPALPYQAAACLYSLCGDILDCERLGVARDVIINALEPVRDLLARSPFFRHMQVWPRGYAGDFEIIEKICDAANRAPPGTLEHCFEREALQCAGAQQHRNKVRHQAQLLLETALDPARPAPNILIAACGGARDLRSIQHLLAGSRARFVLNDLDPDALDLARAQLPHLAGRTTFLQGNVLTSGDLFREHGPYDAIVTGGLYDYLSDGDSVALLRTLTPLLRDRGKLLFTNIATGNPYRLIMEYLAHWVLIERSEDDLRRLCRAADVPDRCVSVRREESGVTLLCEISKGAR